MDLERGKKYLYKDICENYHKIEFIRASEDIGKTLLFKRDHDRKEIWLLKKQIIEKVT